MSTFRYRTIQIFILIAFAAILFRLFQLQILEGPKHAAIINKLKSKADKPSSRMDIVDRNGKVLALDVSNYTLEFNPRESSEDIEKLFYSLNRITGFNDKNLLYKNSSRILATNLTKEQAQEIKQLHSQLLYLRKTNMRYYPQKKLAAHILGYVDRYGKARQGIEARFEEDLLIKDSASKNSSKQKFVLSIDSRLQALVEKALEEKITETKSEKGTVLVMDTDTGELLTWAVYPSFNPNQYYKFPLEHIKNWSTIDVYQPGSIFKIVTVASALDSKTIKEDVSFVDEGYIKVDNWKISNHDYNPSKTEAVELDLEGLFARSSNPFAAHIALEMGAELFYNYIKLFGFAQKTGVEVFGESKGILRDFSKWRSSDIAATGIGHGAISVTPLQLLSAVNVVANDGLWVRPTLLKLNNREKRNLDSMHVISAKTAHQVTKFLADSVAYNVKEKHRTAGNVKDLSIAGKTGTAEKIKKGGGYSKSKTVASFLGYFPAEKPRYIALVVIDDPKTDGGWGDTVAGPLFNKVAEFCKNLYL